MGIWVGDGSLCEPYLTGGPLSSSPSPAESDFTASMHCMGAVSFMHHFFHH